MTAPLAGLRVVVTRSRSQASGLSERLRELGAIPIEIATIEIAEPADGGAGLATAAQRLSRYAWVVLASPNGARSFLRAIDVGGFPERLRVACVGPTTGQVLTDAGLAVDLLPERYVAEGLLDVMPDPAVVGEPVLLVQAEVSRPTLSEGLEARGFAVDRVIGYRTVDAEVSQDRRTVAAGADVVTFTSSSTVERFVRLVGRAALPPVVVTIGPITSATARDLDVEVTVEAGVHTLDGLVDALVAWAGKRLG